MIIPSIDLMNNKLVQLKQGKDKIIEIEGPIKYAKRFSKFSDIQVIDLDAAFDIGNNLNLIKRICKIARCRVGGGIRNLEKAKELIDAGAEKIIIGTSANKEFLSRLRAEIGKERIIVALDSKNGKIAIKGWTEILDKSPVEMAKELKDYCSEFLYTCIEKEGLMKGTDLGTIRKLRQVTKNKISIAGGISTFEEVKELDRINVDCVVGMAIYTGKINPEEFFIESLNFKKMNNLIPTIIKDIAGNVLMLAYSNKESLQKTFETGRCWYFSRERKRLWMKGEASGNIQEIIEIKTDCDKDALLFIVRQKRNACHLNNYSCFEEIKKFNLEELYKIIKNRIKTEDQNSYSYSLYINPRVLNNKIIEEAIELTKTKNRRQVRWESADLIYFLIVFLVKRGIKINDIIDKLEERNKMAKNKN